MGLHNQNHKGLLEEACRLMGCMLVKGAPNEEVDRVDSYITDLLMSSKADDWDKSFFNNGIGALQRRYPRGFVLDTAFSDYQAWCSYFGYTPDMDDFAQCFRDWVKDTSGCFDSLFDYLTAH